MEYYLFLANEQKGPYTLNQLKSMWRAGSITGNTLYWQEGFSEWIPLSSIIDDLEATPTASKKKSKHLSSGWLILLLPIGLIIIISAVWTFLKPGSLSTYWQKAHITVSNTINNGRRPAFSKGDVYRTVDEKSIIFISTTELEMREGDMNVVCKYSVQDKKLRVVSGDLALYYDILENGLRDQYNKTYWTQDEYVAQKCLSNANHIALACRLFAQDNNGSYPETLSQLIPTYLLNDKEIVCPISSDQNGYEYYGGKDSDPSTKVLLRARHTTHDGRRVIIYADRHGELVKDSADTDSHSSDSSSLTVGQIIQKLQTKLVKQQTEINKRATSKQVETDLLKDIAVKAVAATGAVKNQRLIDLLAINGVTFNVAGRPLHSTGTLMHHPTGSITEVEEELHFVTPPGATPDDKAQINALEENYKSNIQQLERTKNISEGLELLRLDLIELSKTDPDADALLRKYNLQYSQ